MLHYDRQLVIPLNLMFAIEIVTEQPHTILVKCNKEIAVHYMTTVWHLCVILRIEDLVRACIVLKAKLR